MGSLPNAPIARRAKIADATTTGHTRLTGLMASYQLLADVDYRIRDPITVGVKLFWVDFG